MTHLSQGGRGPSGVAGPPGDPGIGFPGPKVTAASSTCHADIPNIANIPNQTATDSEREREITALWESS